MILTFTSAYFFFNCIQNGKVSTQWKILDSLYFSAVTFATLGYGDFAPVTFYAKLLTVVEAILGLSFTALFVVSLGRTIIRD